MLTLYHWEPNGPSLEVLAALCEKGVSYESRYVDFLARETWSLPFKDQHEVAFNIEIEGPVLVDRGQAMTDAFFINQYVEDVAPEPSLRPADPLTRWKISMWARVIGEDLAPAVHTLGVHAYLAPKLKNLVSREAIEALPTRERRDSWTSAFNGAYDEAAVADARRKAGFVLKRVEEALADGPFLTGEQVTLADFCLLGQANSLPKLAPEVLESYPRTAAWLERMRARPSVQAALATARTSAPDEAFAPGPEPSRWG